MLLLMCLDIDGFPTSKGFIRLWYLTTIASLHGQGFISRATLHALPLTNPRHTLLSCTILLACLTSKPLFLKQSFTVSIHLLRGLPTENTFINLFVYILRHPAQLPYPGIRDFIHSPDTQQTSEFVHLYSPNPRLLLLPPSHCPTTIRKNRHQQ